MTAGKIKANAVTSRKSANAVTAKLREGAVNLGKLAAGTNVDRGRDQLADLGHRRERHGRSRFPTPASFTPAAGCVYLLNVEAPVHEPGPLRPRSECRVAGATRSSTATNGGPAPASSSRAFAPTAEAPSGVDPGGRDEPARSASRANGATQTIGAKLIGSPRCSSSSTVTVVVAVTAFDT